MEADGAEEKWHHEVIGDRGMHRDTGGERQLVEGFAEGRGKVVPAGVVMLAPSDGHLDLGAGNCGTQQWEQAFLNIGEGDLPWQKYHRELMTIGERNQRAEEFADGDLGGGLNMSPAAWEDTR